MYHSRRIERAYVQSTERTLRMLLRNHWIPGLQEMHAESQQTIRQFEELNDRAQESIRKSSEILNKIDLR